MHQIADFPHQRLVAIDDRLGGGTLDLRPLEARTVSGNAARTTAVALRQTDDGSYGALVDHVVSFAGDDERAAALGRTQSSLMR